jgi:hypothetical protein
MRKCFRIITILISWVALVAAGFIAAERSAVAQDGFPLAPKKALKPFFPGTPLPSAPCPQGLLPGKWKLEITHDFVKVPEPELKKECPVPEILEKLRAPGPAIKINYPKIDCNKNGKNGNGEKKNGDKKNDDKKNGGKKCGGNADDLEDDEDPDTGWDVDRPWISILQG